MLYCTHEQFERTKTTLPGNSSCALLTEYVSQAHAVSGERACYLLLDLNRQSYTSNRWFVVSSVMD